MVIAGNCLLQPLRSERGRVASCCVRGEQQTVRAGQRKVLNRRQGTYGVALGMGLLGAS